MITAPRINHDLCFVWLAEKIVIAPHDLLIGTGQKQAEIIVFTVFPGMQFECLFHILQIDETVDFAVTVAGHID